MVFSRIGTVERRNGNTFSAPRVELRIASTGGFSAVRRYRHARGRLIFILEPCIGIVAGRILARQIGVHGMDDQFVVRHASFFQRLIAGDDQLVRIDELPLLPDTEIEMGAGRRAGRTHVADGLPLRTRLPFFMLLAKRDICP